MAYAFNPIILDAEAGRSLGVPRKARGTLAFLKLFKKKLLF